MMVLNFQNFVKKKFSFKSKFLKGAFKMFQILKKRATRYFKNLVLISS